MSIYDKQAKMFYCEEKDKIKYYKSSIIDDSKIIHAFTTRSCGTLGTAGEQELKPLVEKNRREICKILSLSYENLVIPEQKHTDNIKIVTSVCDDVSNTDGLITSAENIVLMLLFADCTPIILHSEKDRVIGVIHAGWRGTAKKIAQKAISLFVNDFNVNPENIKAMIGPAIGQCCYPVSKDTALELQKSIKEDHGNIFKKDKKEDKISVDLKKLNACQLEEMGVINIDISPFCTNCMKDIFYSYRGDNAKTGRHAAIASIIK